MAATTACHRQGGFRSLQDARRASSIPPVQLRHPLGSGRNAQDGAPTTILLRGLATPDSRDWWSELFLSSLPSRRLICVHVTGRITLRPMAAVARTD
jgi:hypothetical protein